MSFLWKIIRNHPQVRAMLSTHEELVSHIENNAGFIDENGTLRNSNGGNETIAKNWSKFHALARKGYDVYRGQTQGESK